jgi:hypothetical protein
MERLLWRGLIVVGLYTVISLLVDKYGNKKAL